MTDTEALQSFLDLEAGYYKVTYRSRTYGMRIEVSNDGCRRKLYAEELGGIDQISCNLYLLKDRTPLLKPCEMPGQKVLDFISGFQLRSP